MSSKVVANVAVVAVGGRGILIEGPPGSGKSSLALALIDRGAVLIGDDGVTLAAKEGTILASPPPNTAGLLEIRNVGIVELPTTHAPLALILSLDREAARYPLEVSERVVEGIPVPVLPFAAGDAVQALRAEYALLKHGLRFPPTLQTA